MTALGLSRTGLGAVVLVVLAGLLGGCSGAAVPTDLPSGDYSDLTLAESKSPAQLLRNTAVLRIPDAMVQSVGSSTDVSIPCLDDAEDPAGYIRQWQSVVDVELQPEAAPSTQIIVEGVVRSFTDEGWRAQRMAGTAANNIGHLLIYDATGAALTDLAQLQIEGIVRDDLSSGYIHVVGLGPCVVTDGEGSKEVTAVEQPEG